jgi:putative membrane protein
MPRVLAVGMSLTIMCSTVGVTAYSAGADQNKPSAAQTTDGKSAAENAKGASDSKRFSKEETVYVIADAAGAPQKVIVSDWIKNPGKANAIQDKSNLTDIENTKGDETYTIDENKMYEWGANGNDIYYRGKSDDQLPVAVSVQYEIDGKAVSPKELAGKSGRLKIKIDYTNRQFEEVSINGKKEKIYVQITKRIN